MDNSQPFATAHAVECNDAVPLHNSDFRGDAAAGPHDIRPGNYRLHQSENYTSARMILPSERRNPEEGQGSRNTLEAVHYQSSYAVPLDVHQSLGFLSSEMVAAHPNAHGSDRGRGSSYGRRMQEQCGRLGSRRSRRRQPAVDNTSDAGGASTSQTLNPRMSPGVFQDRSPPQRASSGQMHDAPSSECAAVRSECSREPHRDSVGGAGVAANASASPCDSMAVNSREFSAQGRGRGPSRRRGRGSRGWGPFDPSISTTQGSDTLAGPQVVFARHGARRGAGGRGRASLLVDGRGSDCTPSMRQPVVMAPKGPDRTCGVIDYSGSASVRKSSEAVAEAADGASGSDGDEETLTCVICCEAASAVVKGSCGHSQTCAKCCLRLRLCYHDLRCPLCKAVNKEVVVVRPSLALGSSFEPLAMVPQQREALWQQPRWAKGVLVYDPLPQAGELPLHELEPQPQQKPRQGMSRRRPLHKTLLAMTSCSCSVCDHHGHHPFGTMNLLQEHLRSAHNKMLCDVCVGAGLKFALEYPTYDTEGLAAHMAERHPRCEFCNLPFYGPDELYGHMTQRHFTCHVCSRLGRHHLYFQDADTLQVHFREEHHVCDHPDCFGCMIAFATRDELAGHIRDRHSSHMPRWDHSRARPLLLDFVPSRGPAATNAAAGPAVFGRSGLRNDQRGRGSGTDRRHHPDRTGRSGLEEPGAFPSLPSQRSTHPPPLPQQWHGGLADVRDTEGGLVVIDDDLGLGSGPGTAGMAGRPDASSSTAAAVQERRPVVPAEATGVHSLGPSFRLAGAWAGRQPGSGTFREDFPELSAAASSTGIAPRTAWGAGGSITEDSDRAAGSPQQHRTTASLLSLRKVTVRCACGNRVEHLALRSVEEPPQLACHRDCATKQRRAQLADAFGVDKVDGHVAYFDRHRTPHFTAEQILAAQAAGIDWVATVERDLATFLADPSVRRTSLAPGMSQAQRKLVHELAEHYGLSSYSVGQGASRAVQLLKAPSSGVPTRLLSVVAAAAVPDELARLAAGSGGVSGPGWVIKLVDIAPGVDVHKHLWTWDGDCTITPVQGSSSSLRLTFKRESAFRDCCARLGGGMRGVFRTVVERDQDPRRAGAATVAGPTGTAGAAKPVAPAVVPPGWQVLRGKVAVPRAHKGGAGSRSGRADPASSIRSALAADAWASDNEGSLRLQSQYRPAKEGITDGSGTHLGGSTVAPSAVVTQLHLPRRGPSLELELAVPWSALMSEGWDEDGELDGEGCRGADREGAIARQATVNTTESKEAMQGSWDDFDAQRNEAQ
ncbi:hypothetical protein VaNZ11_012933 [Volvox africanus]|uniref:RING-type E3 ubiquitin transferase n=1 Tax=Volvox africanus TaxID=51714 RepID=A0ABQ5SF17_9CHLO|nr:hypothetical protein VaNZ11_012933 [Volvox africanus]